MPAISVCIPTYNQENYIRETILSVLTQTFEDFELIICDDCSSDRTYDVALSFDDRRIKLYRNEINLGLAANWSKSISLASGEYIKLLCGDDIIYKDCLRLQFSALKSNPLVYLVTSARDIIGPNSKRIFTIKPPLPEYELGPRAISKTLKAGTNIFGEPGSVMFKSSAINAIKFNDEFPYVIDIDMWIQILLKGDVCVLKDTLSAFRISKTHLTSKMASSQSHDFSCLIDKFAKEVSLSKTYVIVGKLRSKVNMVCRYIIHHLCCNF